MTVEIAAATVAHATTAESVAFWVLAPVAVASALCMLLSRKAVHSALWMAATMMILAVFFLMNGAVFLGVVQVVVYTGAVMMLFLFVLMLVGVDASDSLVETLRGQRPAVLLLGLGFGALLVGLIAQTTVGDVSVGLQGANDAAGGHLEAIAKAIFTHYLLAFEVTGALLITAAVSAMVLTHRERLVPRKTQADLSRERTRGDHLPPLPAAGVYARHNAVDTPALLPDGSPSELSVPSVLRHRGDVRPPASVALEAGAEPVEEEDE